MLRQEVQEPGIYSTIIEAIAGGASKSNEIATKIGEETEKCLKYIGVLRELGILYKEIPFGEKETSRRTLYGISDFMFRFWYRYVYANRTLVETGAVDAVMKKRIEPDYSDNKDYLFCECKWRNEKLDLGVVKKLIEKADMFSKNRNHTWLVLFSKSGFTDAVIEAAKEDESLILVGLDKIMALGEAK